MRLERRKVTRRHVRTCRKGLYFPYAETPATPLSTGPWHRTVRHIDWKASALRLPTHHAIDSIPGASVGKRQTHHQPDPATMVPPGCTLGDLPVELVLRFLAPVIPDGHIFHLGPHQHEVKGVQPRYVHQIVALPNDDPTVCLSELALCGRKVKEVVYALFYGRNQFVLELAAVSHGAHVAVSKTFHATSWNRIVHSRPDTLPLSHDILLYVKDLTISIGLTYGGGTIRERGAIKAQLQELADAFVDQDHALKKITVGLTTLKQVDKRWTSNNLKLKYGLPNVAMRLALARFSNRQAAMLREAIASMLMPLTQLSDVEVEVVVNGKGS